MAKRSRELELNYGLSHFMSFKGRNDFLRDIFKMEGYLKGLYIITIKLTDNDKVIPEKFLDDIEKRELTFELKLGAHRRYPSILAKNIYDTATDYLVSIMAEEN